MNHASVRCWFATLLLLTVMIVPVHSDEPPSRAERPKQELERLQELTARCDRFKAASELAEAALVAREILALELLHYGREHPRVIEWRKRCAALDQEAATQRQEWKYLSDHILKLRSEQRTDEALGATVALLKLQRMTFGNEHTEVAEALRLLCKQEEIDGRAESTVSRYEEIVRTLTAVLGKEHWRVAEAQLNLRTAKALSRLSRAEQRSLAGIRAWAGGLDVSTATQDPSVSKQLESDLSQVEKLIGTENSLFVLLLLTAGDAYSKMGRLADADRAYRRVADLSNQVAGQSHYFYSTALSRLANSRGGLADGDTAVSLADQAAELTGRHMGLYSEDYLVRLRTLGTVQYRASQHAAALASFKKLELLHFEVRGAGHPDTAAILLDVAFASLTENQPDQAVEYARRALLNLRDKKMVAHPEYLRCLLLVAQLDDNAGRTEQARTEFEQLATLTRQVYPESHPQRAVFLGATSGHFQMHEQAAAAAEILEEVLAAQRISLHDRFSVQSEAQQLAAVAAMRGAYFGYLTACTELTDHAELAWQQSIVWQRIVSRRQARIAASAGDPKSADARQELQQVARQLSAAAFQQTGPLSSEQQQKLDLLSKKLNELELRLAEHSGPQGQEVGPQEIIDRLPEDSVLLDFVLYNHLVPERTDKRIGFRRESRLLAFVARRKQQVRMISLGPAGPIQAAADEWRKLLSAGRGESPQAFTPATANLPQRQLRRLLWDPLVPFLAGAKRVLYVPDGPLCEVPLAALPGGKPEQYLIDEYRFMMLPSVVHATRVPDATQKSDSVGDSILLMGDLAFGDPAAKVTNASRMASTQFVPLPGTKREVQSIGDLFKQRFPDGKLTSLQQQAASETTFRQTAPRHRLLHLATHGFCILENPELLRSAEAKGAGDLMKYLEARAPEVLSGIALANANLKGPAVGDTETDDGILTALELSTLDLRHVDLAVLSACESGLGQENNGEGLLGLQRALHIAGVRTTVTSLWKVDDAATETLMTEFYRNLWQEQLSPGDALRQAQLTMVDRYDTSKRQLQPRGLKLVAPAGAQTRRLPPYFWAAFCVSGDGNDLLH